jgi:hypothetical protein
MDINVKVRDVFMGILEEEKIFELVAVPANVMVIWWRVKPFVRETTEEAVPVRVHAVDVESVGEE